MSGEITGNIMKIIVNVIVRLLFLDIQNTERNFLNG